MEERRRGRYRRWDIHQRIQHICLLSAFIILVATGFPMRYAAAPSAQAFTLFVGGAYVISIIHRFAGSLLILTSFYHIGYVGYHFAKGQRWSEMIPAWKDVVDFLQMWRYNLGLTREKPKYGRYSFTEKFEYWGMVWGSAVMILTGLLLWNPVRTTWYFKIPILLALSRVIHSYEALLAVTAILIWHLYNAHLRPDVFPMSPVWLTGLMTEEDMKEHHGLEYERLVREHEDKCETPG